MWMPNTEEEIDAVVTGGALEEGPMFDAKRELPGNKDIAIDLVAMSVDGGVIVYGIAEDENRRPTVLNPISLAGQRERIESIARTAVQEPVPIKGWTVPTNADPSKGYIVVVIPLSERAPHMVTVRGTNRYYGRKGTQNVPLTEGEVARLYDRRERWEVDRDALLDAVVGNAPLEPHPGFGYLHLIAQPVMRREFFLEGIVPEGDSIDNALSSLVNRARANDVFPQERFVPDLDYADRWERRVEGYRNQMGIPNRPANDPNAIRYTLNLQINNDGSVHIFCGRAADMEGETFLLLPILITGLTVRFLSLVSELYARGGYVGMVDLGIAVTSIEGAYPHIPHRGILRFAAYDQPEYRRTCRVSALTLEEEIIPVTRQLLTPLFRATLQDMYDPISQVPQAESAA